MKTLQRFKKIKNEVKLKNSLIKDYLARIKALEKEALDLKEDIEANTKYWNIR